MSIDSISFAPKPSGNKPVESGSSALPADPDSSNNFANALKEQNKAINEMEGKEESQAVMQSAPDSSDIREVKNDAGEQDQLLALFENYFSMDAVKEEKSAAESEPSSLNLESGASTVLVPSDASVNQAMSAKPEPVGLVSPSLAEDAELESAQRSLSTNISWQKPGAAAEQDKQTGQKLNPQFEAEAETFKQALAAVAGPESEIPEVRAEPQPVPKPTDNRVENSVIAKPLSHPGWSKDLGEHIIWMNNKEISAAEIKLNPVYLGPISVRIDVNEENQTSILIAAQHPETKEALETSLPKLREMLQGQQLNLVNVNVSQHSGSNQGRSPFQAFAGLPGNSDPATEAMPPDAQLSESGQVVSKGLLSLYA